VGTTASAREATRHTSMRRGSLAAVLAMVCWALSGCAADFNAQTNQQYQPGEGINDRSTDVYVLNALVVADGQGNGTLVGTLLNQATTPDALTSVAAADGQGQSIRVTKLVSPMALAPQHAVKLETDAAVRLTGAGVVSGDFITVQLTFQQAAPLQLDIPVLADGPIYTGVPVGPGDSGPAAASTSSG